MIIQTTVTVDGQSFLHTRSNAGYQIERDGVLYDEAIDPIDSVRTYTESDVPVAAEVEIEIEDTSATIEDYQAALAEFGVQV